VTAAVPLRLELIVVTEPDVPGRSVPEIVAAALRGGARAVQLRWKDGGAREMAELGRELLRETRAADARLFVNDRLDVALAIGADGVHLGQDDLPVRAARELAPPGFLIGVSAETRELARAAWRGGADYVGVGPVFATGSKLDAGEAVGTARVREIAGAVDVPVVGIGGIGPANAGEVVAVGAAGVAVISAVTRAADPERASAALLEALRRG
jgi:thiamine-phosphate pyrophosphorylase